MSVESDAEAQAFVLDLLAGRCRAQAVSTAAALGLADRLAQGPREVAQLALELECDAGALERLLDLLAGLDLCRRVDASRFAPTVRGAALREGALGPLAAFLGTPLAWDPWSRLRDRVRAGGPGAFEHTHGAPLYSVLAHHPEAARAYDAAIDAFTRDETAALCERIDLSGVRQLVDVGGGRGTALIDLLSRWDRMQGLLFDLPHVVEHARARLDGRFPARLELLAGDFRTALPGGADAYLLRHVLHNWDDEQAGALLRRCAEALAAGGRVLAIEALLAPDERVDAARLLDLEMLVLTGGRERRKPELRRLFHGAGLTLERAEPLTPSSWLLVGARRV